MKDGGTVDIAWQVYPSGNQNNPLCLRWGSFLGCWNVKFPHTFSSLLSVFYLYCNSHCICLYLAFSSTQKPVSHDFSHRLPGPQHNGEKIALVDILQNPECQCCTLKKENSVPFSMINNCRCSCCMISHYSASVSLQGRLLVPITVEMSGTDQECA